MRAVVVIVAITGCRQVLGIEDGVLATPPDGRPPGIDAPPGVDAPLPPLDGPGVCPPTYVVIPNGTPNHRYRFIDLPATWVMQRDACAQEGGFLAFPDGANPPAAQAELAAILNFGNQNLWMGLDDLVTEGVFRTSLDQPASAATLSLITNPGEPLRDCIRAGSPSSMNEEDCGTNRRAVCECVP